jgi:hypothetical protein
VHSHHRILLLSREEFARHARHDVLEWILSGLPAVRCTHICHREVSLQCGGGVLFLLESTVYSGVPQCARRDLYIRKLRLDLLRTLDRTDLADIRGGQWSVGLSKSPIV